MVSRGTLIGACACVAGVVWSAGPARAQDSAAVCEAVGQMEAGEWSEYQLLGEPAAEVNSVRFAFLEEGPLEAGSGNWYEFKAQTTQGPVIVQLLVPGFPFEMSEINEVVMKTAGQPAMRIPSEMLGVLQQQMGGNPMEKFARKCAKGVMLGQESVTVPAGDFQAWHMKSADESGEAWLSRDVPFGIVKGVTGDGAVMVLSAYGEGATSSITEEPQDMPMMMPGMPQN